MRKITITIFIFIMLFAPVFQAKAYNDIEIRQQLIITLQEIIKLLLVRLRELEQQLITQNQQTPAPAPEIEAVATSTPAPIPTPTPVHIDTPRIDSQVNPPTVPQKALDECLKKGGEWIPYYVNSSRLKCSK